MKNLLLFILCFIAFGCQQAISSREDKISKALYEYLDSTGSVISGEIKTIALKDSFNTKILKEDCRQADSIWRYGNTTCENLFDSINFYMRNKTIDKSIKQNDTFVYLLNKFVSNLSDAAQNLSLIELNPISRIENFKDTTLYVYKIQLQANTSYTGSQVLYAVSNNDGSNISFHKTDKKDELYGEELNKFLDDYFKFLNSRTTEIKNVADEVALRTQLFTIIKIYTKKK